LLLLLFWILKPKYIPMPFTRRREDRRLPLMKRITSRCFGTLMKRMSDMPLRITNQGEENRTPNPCSG
jgi:hypothetical protein